MVNVMSSGQFDVLIYAGRFDVCWANRLGSQRPFGDSGVSKTLFTEGL